MQDTILQSVGRTPLIRLRRLATSVPAAVYVKLESINPGGSVKDRVAIAMIAEAEPAMDMDDLDTPAYLRHARMLN